MISLFHILFFHFFILLLLIQEKVQTFVIDLQQILAIGKECIEVIEVEYICILEEEEHISDLMEGNNFAEEYILVFIEQAEDHISVQYMVHKGVKEFFMIYLMVNIFFKVWVDIYAKTIVSL
jgi:hypothetical protein